jgi:imidazolonepropionase-like amidohydrolase
MKPFSSILLVLVLSGCATTQGLLAAADPEPSFAIRDVRIFDGERVIPAGTVVIRGDRIAAVGEGVDLSEVDDVIDGQGQTLLPGLIDAHFHADGPEAYKAALVFGQTTVIDMFGDYSAFATHSKLGALAHRPDDEADPLVSMLVTAPGAHGTEDPRVPVSTVTTARQCRDAVNSQLDAGASFVKLVYDSGAAWAPKPVPTLTREVLTACVEAAHARGVLAIVHVLDLREAREALEAGVDGLAHGIADAETDAALAQLVAARGAFVIPTLAVISGITRKNNDKLILSDTRLAPYVAASGVTTLTAPYPDWFGQRMNSPFVEASVRQFKAAQVPVLAGSDCGNPGTAAGVTLHQELELLVASGLTPTEALMAATSLPASRFRLSDRGRIAPGLRADLLLVRGDPTQDIQTTRDIVAVWKRGKKLNREAWRAHVATAHTESPAH